METAWPRSPCRPGTRGLKLMQEDHTSSFSISASERRWMLILLDTAALNGSLLLALALRSDYALSGRLVLDHPEWFLFLNGLWFFISYFFQVYDLQKAGQTRRVLSSVLSAAFLTMLIYLFTPYLPPRLPNSRAPLFLTLLLPTAGLLLGRVVYLFVFSRRDFRRRVLIVGAGELGKTIFRVINQSGKSLYQLVGFIDDDHQTLGTLVEIEESIDEQLLTHPACMTVIGRSQHLPQIVEQYQVTTIVLAVTENVDGKLYQILADCMQFGIEIMPMSVLYEELTGKVPVENIGDQWSVSMPLEHPGTRLVWHAAKRAFDLLWAVIGLLVLGILLPWICLAILIDSGRPIFYTQQRVGRYGKPFTVHKFRSMVVQAERDQAVWAQDNDPRVTGVGRWLRKTHLDEFPQFWNILKGEMSAVGPRPERPELINQLEREIPFYKVRLAVKPGMAGWALIHQGYGASARDTLEKLQYDLYYIKHQSFWLDLYILGRTILNALQFQGR